jgi:hypothetical protein
MKGERPRAKLGPMRTAKLPLLASVSGAAVLAQTDDYRLALPDHAGLLKWSVSGCKIVENSAKSNGRQIGVKGASTQTRFLSRSFPT